MTFALSAITFPNHVQTDRCSVGRKSLKSFQLNSGLSREVMHGSRGGYTEVTRSYVGESLSALYVKSSGVPKKMRGEKMDGKT